MAIRAILTLNGKEYEVLTFGQKFTQYARSSDNRSNGQVQFGHLEIGLESPEHNDVLELMLRAKYNPNVAGVLEVWTDGDMPLRRIKFSEGFIIHYKETFNLRSKEGMTTRFVIAAWQMEINKLPMQRPQMGYSWIKKPKEVKPLAEKAYVPPIPLVRKVKVEGSSQDTFVVGDTVTFVVTQYNISDVTEEDKKRINWIVEFEGKQKKLIKSRDKQPYKGEKITFSIPKEWAGKKIRIMPYLQKNILDVSVCIDIDRCTHKDGAIHIAEYIVSEIKTNAVSKEAEAIRYYASIEEYKKRLQEWKRRSLLGQILTEPALPNMLKAKILWSERVFKGRPWDHKPKIKALFAHLAVERTEYSEISKKNVTYKSYYHKYKEYDYFYDVWSNIHYGYIGLSVGFSKETLLGGADWAQIFDSSGFNSQDAPDDKVAIQIGFDLYAKHGKFAKELTAQDVLNALELAVMTESKKKHICTNESK